MFQLVFTLSLLLSTSDLVGAAADVTATSVIQEYSCPTLPGIQHQITIPSNETTVKLIISNTNTLCTLTQVFLKENHEENNVTVAPVGRSYDGYPWERVAGLFSHLEFTCKTDNDSNASSCTVTLPEAALGQSFRLTMFEHHLSPKNQLARFLEKATFSAWNGAGIPTDSAARESWGLKVVVS